MVNRYVRALQDREWNSKVKKGDSFKIIQDESDFFYLDCEYDKGSFSKSRLNASENSFELMPEGWTPDNVDNNLLKNLQIW